MNRWWGLVAGIVLAASDTAVVRVAGTTIEVNGRDATLLVGAFFGTSFALLGFLIGYVIEGRRRDREAAALIRTQVETIAAARARLAQSEKLAALGQLATAIAHEVRNPLAVIRSAAQGIAESLPAVDASTRRSCGFITDEIDRLSSVVTSLLAFARPPQLQPRAISVGPLLERAATLAREDLDGRAVRLVREEPGELPALRADPDLLCQVLLGLLANAAEAAGAGGQISLEARAADGMVELGVADSGPGVPPDLRERIFEPFFTTKAPGSGTGLGLSQAYGIISEHRGHIAVDSHRGEGTTFTIYLPDEGGRVITEGAGSAEIVRGRGETLLVVEDEALVRQSLALVLGELNYEVLTATGAEQALELYTANAGRIALVLTDLVMPGMGGLRFVRELRERGAHIPMVMMSGYVDESSRGSVEGITAWIQKPVRARRLGTVIHEALSARAR